MVTFAFTVNVSFKLALLREKSGNQKKSRILENVTKTITYSYFYQRFTCKPFLSSLLFLPYKYKLWYINHLRHLCEYCKETLMEKICPWEPQSFQKRMIPMCTRKDYYFIAYLPASMSAGWMYLPFYLYAACIKEMFNLFKKPQILFPLIFLAW